MTTIGDLQKARLTVEGKTIQQMLVANYGMTEDGAKRLLMDGGTMLQIALMGLKRR